MTKKEQQFIKIVQDFYHTNGRHDLPWRKTKDPYKILVSEVMLQQTQVGRVLPKYEVFLEAFPGVEQLAQANLSQVLTLWQGLGYNRRAKMLHLCAKEVCEVYEGKFPDTQKQLCTLPGIGSYTAGAVLVFAFNKPVVIIETNIRTVFTHHFFKNKTEVSDASLIRYIQRTVDTEDPRQWYWALMDYGTFLKKEYGSINNRSKHYTKQSTFKGSDREIRGAILRLLIEKQDSYTKKEITALLNNFDRSRIAKQLDKLLDEEMLVRIKQKYNLPT